jgi:hypothetical protein
MGLLSSLTVALGIVYRRRGEKQGFGESRQWHREA